MPTPDQKPPEGCQPHIPEELRAQARRTDAALTAMLTHPAHGNGATLDEVHAELRHARAEIAELRRALLPSTSGLILGADAAAEYRRIVSGARP